MVDVHLLAGGVQVRTAGQVRSEGGQRDELHQLNVWDVPEAAVIGVSPAHLVRGKQC